VKAGIHELVYNWCVLSLSNLTETSLLELPPKIPYFASLFVVANARKQVIGKDILDFSIAKLKEILEQGDLGKAKLILRFLAGLARIVEADGIMNVIGEFISKFEGEEANVFFLGNEANSRRGWIIWRDSYCSRCHILRSRQRSLQLLWMLWLSEYPRIWIHEILMRHHSSLPTKLQILMYCPIAPTLTLAPG
jgi:hypothetical protein